MENSEVEAEYASSRHIGGLLCKLPSTLTDPQQPMLMLDWHLRSYITSLNSSATTSVEELTTGEKKRFDSAQKPKHHICQRHSFVLNSTFYPFTSIPSTNRPGLMTYSAEKKSQLPGSCVCVDCGFRSGEAMGGKRRRRREVRGCGKDSGGLASGLPHWPMGNIMLYTCASEGFYRVRVNEGETDHYGSWNSIIREKGLAWCVFGASLSDCVCV